MISRRQEIFFHHRLSTYKFFSSTDSETIFLIPQISHNRGSLYRQFFQIHLWGRQFISSIFLKQTIFSPVTIPSPPPPPGRNNGQSYINTFLSRHDQIRSEVMQAFYHNFGLKATACFLERLKVGKIYCIALGSGRFLVALGIFETHQFEIVSYIYSEDLYSGHPIKRKPSYDGHLVNVPTVFLRNPHK